MYLGKIVEISPAEELYQRPIHPYTEALLSAVPIPDPAIAAQAQADRAAGRRPEPDQPAVAAAASTRAAATPPRSAQPRNPQLIDHGGGHVAACHHPLHDTPAVAASEAEAP